MSNDLTFISDIEYTALVDEKLGIRINLTFRAVKILELGGVRYQFSKDDDTVISLDTKEVITYFGRKA